jgi:5-(carboxyamino)imidazole ribonucleotide mutase
MKPIVGILMGSDSDLKIMAKSAKMLEELDIPYELTIISAHRTPDKFLEYMRTAKERGLKVVIAGAGGAAHLPGMAAALTVLPVIGVPIETKALGGVDSLYSIVQMPSGIPVATVAINGAANAGLLAGKILAVGDAELTKKVEAYAEKLKAQVEAKAEKIEKIKYQAYLDQMQ